MKIIKEYIQSDGKKLRLSEEAITHVYEGNFVVRTQQGDDNMTVLRGGLHSCSGWNTFRNNYNKELSHLHFFNSNIHKYWYYARELSNGVITLRLPRDLFSGKAAKITMYPDDYYKSGYLWKTLFPKHFDRNAVIEAIDEALENEDITQRSNGQIIGYINNDEPMKTMKIVIQFKGTEIKSAFPAWTQPNSGNVGKPFSHYDNIGFIISQSTEYFEDNYDLQNEMKISVFGEKISPDYLPDYTPMIFKRRTKINEKIKASEWIESRRKELSSMRLDDKDNDRLYEYINDHTILKYYPEITSGAYSTALDLIFGDECFHNSFQIVQNIVDGMYYLLCSNQKERLIKTICNVLDNMVTHTNFDQLLKKKIMSTVILIVTYLNDSELSYKFILTLSTSPIRREAYLEYNLNSIHKKKLQVPTETYPVELDIIDNPNLDFQLEYKDFIEFLKELYSETYTLNFDEEMLNNLLNDVIDNQEKNYKFLISDALKYFSKEDFLSLSYHFDKILNSAQKYELGDSSKLIESCGLILRDYCRIQFAHRQRINARYLKYNDYVSVISIDYIDHNLLYGKILKHERISNLLNLTRFTDGMLEFALKTEDKSFETDIHNFKARIGKEKPPLPEIM
ncbi:hypothetical protein ACED29_17500 [Shewanella sp. 5S214]|uniref:hypothetical protein n=1 Tax=Shewanella sp. 5S214 TaxID=3229999 RepID=UPI00352DE334